MHLIYLHGFASSPGSKKANYFKSKLESDEVSYHIPDLNVPDFAHLTLTAMLGQVATTIKTLPDGDVTLIGSSMGGLTALHFCDRYRDAEADRVKHMILLAPALDFLANRERQDPEMMTTWREQGHYPFFNYAHDKEMPVHYGLIEDIRQYDSYATTVNIPTLIYHGKHDASVDYHQSVRYADPRDNVTLHILDSDHQLLDQTDVILDGIKAFVGID